MTLELRKIQYNTFITSRSYVQQKHQFHKDQLFDYVMCDTTGLQDAADMIKHTNFNCNGCKKASPRSSVIFVHECCLKVL